MVAQAHEKKIGDRIVGERNSSKCLLDKCSVFFRENDLEE